MLTHTDVKTADPKERSFQGILLAGCQILVVALPVGMFWMEGKSKVKQHLRTSAAIGVRAMDSVACRLSGRQMSLQAAREALARLDNDQRAQLLALGCPMRPLQVFTPLQFSFSSGVQSGISEEVLCHAVCRRQKAPHQPPSNCRCQLITLARTHTSHTARKACLQRQAIAG